MSFTSLAFPVFFFIVAIGFYLFPRKFRWSWLLIASCYFYMAFVPKYILILFALIIIDFTMALLIERTQGHKRRICFLISIIANIGILFVFKYFNFFNENLTLLAQAIGWNYSIAALRLILPLGLSFHTFQSLSYVIEVYRGKYPASRNIGIYALYVLFFPQLIAGPIERPQHLLEELKHTDEIRFDMPRILSGLRLMAWGFFKKMVIADRLGISVDYIYAHISSVSGISIFVATVFFAFQLYTDFSGYSDIARGSARVFGIDVVRNFERPYFSLSIAEFWRRWHISLSSWFRDYFYYPLAYARKRATRTWLYFCIIVTFLVTGLWHGAGWTFITMGALFGVFIVLGIVTKSWRERFVKYIRLDQAPRLHRTLQQLMTFALVSFAWIFFRAPDMSTAFAFIGRFFTGWNMPLPQFVHDYIVSPFTTLGFSRGDLLLSLGGITALLVLEHVTSRRSLADLLDRRSLSWQSFAYVSLALSLSLLSVLMSTQFIYFQF